MSVRCLAQLGQITEHANWAKRDSPFKGNMKTLTLGGISPNQSTVPDDLKADVKKFWDASPSLEIKLGCINPEASQYFEVDGIYEVTFRKIGQLQRD